MAKAVPLQQQDATTLTSPRWRIWSNRLKQQVVPRIILVILCAIFLLPFYWMMVIAFKPTAELSLYPPTLWPREFQWSNFADAVNVFPFWRFLRNTSIITFFTVVGAAISNPIVAYGFSRIDWPGRDKLFALVMATVFIPFPVLIIALFDIFANLGWVNTFLPLTVPMFFGNAFWIFLMRQFFMQIPRDLSEAARLDGASELRTLFQIILPQSYAALSVVSIFAALHAWNDYLGPLLFLQDPSKYTLAIGLTFFQSQSQYDVQFNLLMAASALIILPVVVLFLMFQSTFVEGITLGSIK
jgi:multiple sugar transport system permease protein